MTITAAVACMLVSTAVTPLFLDSLWFAAAAGAVVAVAVTGTLTRLRPLPVAACLAAGAAGLLLYLNLVFEARHSLLAVIPTPGSAARLAGLAAAGLHDANRYTTPVPNVPGLMLLAVGGVGITAVMTDLIAVRLRSAALAGLPLLVLFCVPVIMNASHDQLADGVVFCLAGAGYLAMLAVGGRPSTNSTALPVAGGLASIAVALCAPLLLSGVHLSTLFASGADAGGLPQTMAQLHESRPSTVFTYTTTASPSLQQNDPQYFRQYVFDTLDETGWQLTSYPPGTASASSFPQPPGLTDLSAAQPVTTTVTTTGFSGARPAFLPLPYPELRVSVPGRWLADPDLMIYSPVSSLAGMTYSAVSYAIDPSQAQLAAVPPLTGLAGLAPDLQLPPSYRTAALKQLAQAQTSGQATESGKVNALANWLSSPPFRYSLAAAPSASAPGLLSFLTTTRTGYCVQYASAMAVLTRLLGIPARFVTGYTAWHARQRRQLRGQDHRRARLDRGVLPHPGLDPFRAHPGRPGRHRGQAWLYERLDRDRDDRPRRAVHRGRHRIRQRSDRPACQPPHSEACAAGGPARHPPAGPPGGDAAGGHRTGCGGGDRASGHRPCRLPPHPAPMAVDARHRRRCPGPCRVARVPRRPGGLRVPRPAQRTTPHPGRPGQRHAAIPCQRRGPQAGPSRRTRQLRGPPARITGPAPRRHHRPARPGRYRPAQHPLARPRAPRLAAGEHHRCRC